MDATLRALNRFGLGARPGDRGQIGDPEAWLRRQLEGGPPRVEAPADASPTAISEAVRALRMRQADDPSARRDVRRRLVDIQAAESRAALTARVTSQRPFVERLVAFWSNHLCVSAGARILVAPLAGSYEREAIRPHVLGRFADMVLASAKHPAMLAYLDAFQSIGPSSPGARAPGRSNGAGRGLNENYARELLELHTLGVAGGYTQQDVRELAKVLTGWTIDGLGSPAARASRLPGRGRGRVREPAGPQAEDGRLRFGFRERLHEPGSKTVLRVTYAGAGVAEGERAIRDLCRHPSTATFVATKLARHFVADDPPPACVERLAQVFRDSDGDLKAVALALVDAPDAWAEGHRKFRTPQEWVVAALRALDAADVAGDYIAGLRQLRHPLWAPQAPKGFADTMAEWADSDSLLNRAELSRTIGRRTGNAAMDPRALADVTDIPADDPLRGLLADRSLPVAERVALALAGPAFQWR